MNASLEWLVDAMTIVIGIAIPSDVLDNIFSNVFLAFSLVEDFDRRVRLGPYGFPEKFFPSGASAFTLDAFFAEIDALWQTKGWPAAQLTFIDGYPYELGRDLFPGAQSLIVRRGKLYADYLENIAITDNRTQRNRVELQIGDGRHEQSGIVKIQRKLVGIERLVNILTQSTQGA